MPANIEIPFALQKGDAGAVQNSRERLVNMYAEIEASGISKIVRRQRPGLITALALLGEKRCIERFKGIHYAVVGPTLYRVDTSVTALGTLSSVTGRCTMIFNNNGQIMVSDGTTAYYYNGSALALTSLPAGVTCGYLAYLGGFGIFNQPDTGKFYITGENDFSTVDALDFATAESSPDNIVRPFVDHNELWLAGNETTEVWQLSGGTDFPFTPYTNAILQRGCAAPLSYAAEDNTIFFLGDDNVVYRADGYRPVRISTTAIEEAIKNCSAASIVAAHAFVYTWRGSKFLTLTLGAEITLQYNISSGLWNEADTYPDKYWKVISSAGHQSDFLLTTAGVCRLGKVNTDEGGIMRRRGVSAPGYAEGKRITVHEFFLDAEVGHVSIAQNANVMLRFAPDGETFANERWRSLGPIGAYNRRALWRNLGQGRSPVIDVSITDDVEFTVTTTRATVSQATS